MTPFKYLGNLGDNLPILEEGGWNSIFEFLEFFVLAEDILEHPDYSFNMIVFDWNKVRNILILLSKMK